MKYTKKLFQYSFETLLLTLLYGNTKYVSSFNHVMFNIFTVLSLLHFFKLFLNHYFGHMFVCRKIWKGLQLVEKYGKYKAF